MTTHAERVPCTGTHLSDFARVKVDPAQTSFWEGREFHFLDEFSIAAGATKVIKIVSPVDTVVYDILYAIDAGFIRAALCYGGTEGGVFSSPVHSHGANTMSLGPDHRAYAGVAYAQQVLLSSGGTHTGGTEIEITRLKTADNSNFASTFGMEAGLEHGMAAGTYYLRIQNIGAGTTTGTVKARWEERG